MVSYVNPLPNNPILPSFPSYQSFDLTGSVSLVWSTEFINTIYTLALENEVSVNANGYNFKLPDATKASVGQSFWIHNVSGAVHSFNVTDFGNNFLVNIPQGGVVLFTLNDTTTQNGGWSIFPFAGGTSAVTSVAAVPLTTGLTITGSPITSAGTLDFSLGAPLVALNDLITTGFIVKTGASTVAARSLVNGTNIDISNTNGVAGNPTISLNDTITGVNSLEVGDFLLSNNLISTTSVNTNIVLTPNGTGSILLGPGLTPPTVSSTGSLSNVVNLGVTTSASIAQIGIGTNIITSTQTNGNVTVAATGTGNLSLRGSSNTNPLIIDQNNILKHPSIAKCFVVFNGSTGVITLQYNIVSVTVVSTGNYRVTFNSIFSAVAFGAIATTNTPGTFANAGVASADTILVTVRDNSNTPVDATSITVLMYNV